MARSAAAIVDAYNTGREPERYALKRSAMRGDVFVFLRGTAHLFWQRVREEKVAADAPVAWCSGDLHLENFGTYLGDNGLAYFDVNDFDEAAKAPCDWEILRLVTSLAVAAPGLGLGKSETKALMTEAAETYRAELALGKARWVERRTATGAIDDLIAGLKTRSQLRLLDKRTVRRGRTRTLDGRSDRMLPVTEADRAKLAAFAQTLPKMLPGAMPDGYFNFIDGARRIAGTGSLGLQRFVLLVEGEGSPDGNVLLDLKAATPSSLAEQSPGAQPRWKSEAVRVTTTQTRCQAIAPYLLAPVAFDDKPFVVKELQPTADRLDLGRIAKGAGALASVIQTMSRLAAWAQLRSAARDGSASPDALQAFGVGATGFAQRLTDAARALAERTAEDFKDYCKAYDDARDGKSGKQAATGKADANVRPDTKSAADANGNTEKEGKAGRKRTDTRR